MISFKKIACQLKNWSCQPVIFFIDVVSKLIYLKSFSTSTGKITKIFFEQKLYLSVILDIFQNYILSLIALFLQPCGPVMNKG